MSSSNTVWEIVDNDFVEVACEKCAHEFLVERGIQHNLGENYSDEDSGIFISEDVFGEHSECNHECVCGLELG